MKAGLRKSALIAFMVVYPVTILVLDHFYEVSHLPPRPVPLPHQFLTFHPPPRGLSELTLPVVFIPGFIALLLLYLKPTGKIILTSLLYFLYLVVALFVSVLFDPAPSWP